MHFQSLIAAVTQLSSSAGLLRPWAAFRPHQPVRAQRSRWQEAEQKSALRGPSQLHGAGVVTQRDGAVCLASAQLPAAAGLPGGPVLRGSVSLCWIRLRAGSLPLHQQQGGSARVSLQRAGFIFGWISVALVDACFCFLARVIYFSFSPTFTF